jgi:hypothetical protein
MKWVLAPFVLLALAALTVGCWLFTGATWSEAAGQGHKEFNRFWKR